MREDQNYTGDFKGNVVQNIIFNHVIRAKSIKVNMRHAIHDYFGINDRRLLQFL